MKERLFNIKIQQIIAVLVCSILIGSGVSVSNYLSSIKDKIHHFENLDLEKPKYSLNQFHRGPSNQRFTPDINYTIVQDHSINLIKQDTLIISGTSNTSEKNHQIIQTTGVTDEILF